MMEDGVMNMNDTGACSGSEHMSMMMMSMRMYFFFGRQCNLLFKNFNLESPGQIFGGILLVLVLGILYEGLKTLREVLAAREVKQQQGGSTSVNLKSAEGAPLIPAQSEVGYVRRVLREYCSPLHILQSWLHVVQVGLAYILMLIAMTFNGWLFLAVCFGAGIGYFIFGKSRNLANFRSQSEHCH